MRGASYIYVYDLGVGHIILIIVYSYVN